MATALQKFDPNSILPAKPIDTVQALISSFEEVKKKANLLTPLAAISQIKPLHRISLRVVPIDTSVDDTGNGPEVYHSKAFHQNGEVSLGKRALMNLLAAAAAQVLPVHREDDASDPHYCRMTAQVIVKDFDGEYRTFPGTRELDLRQGSAKANSMTPKQLQSARANIVGLCETFAITKALRGVFALKGKYRREELAKPFVVPVLVRHWDMGDPDQKAAAIREAERDTSVLFGGGAKALPAPEREIKDVTPAPALPPPPQPPPPVTSRTREPGDDDDEPARTVDAEVVGADADFELPEPDAVIICLCPCGDQAEISAEVAEKTTEKVGAPRCAACFPGQRFDYERHKALPRGGLLNLPRFPKMTAAEAKAAADRTRR